LKLAGLIWLARLTAFAANCNLMVSYLAFFWAPANSTIPRALIITGHGPVTDRAQCLWRATGCPREQLVYGWQANPDARLCRGRLFFLNPHAFVLGARPSAGAFSQSVLLLIYAFTGFEMAAIPAGEIRNPQSNLPRALLISVVVVAFTYILIQVVCIGTLPELAGSPKPLADAGQRFMGTAGRRDHLCRGNHFDCRKPEYSLAVWVARAFCHRGTETVAVNLCRNPPALFYSARGHPDYRRLMLVLTLKSSFVAALTLARLRG